MPVEFIYDFSEDYSPNRNGFLTPVYFEKEVLIEFIYNPKYNCIFVSETYGTLSLDGYAIPFGINSQDYLICWLGDIKELPEQIQHTLRSKNISSDHNLESEFKQAQLGARFTEPISEVEIFLSLNKINNLSQEKYQFKIFDLDLLPLDELFSICSHYKRITFNNEDDFKRIISEFNEKFVETINKQGITTYLEAKQIPIDSSLGEIKRLELFFNNVLLDTTNKISPFFYLYDLRIWADHSNSQSRYEVVISNLGLENTASFDEVYKKLIQELRTTLNWLLNKLGDED